MVEYPLQLDSIFHSLSDTTRRDILKRLNGRQLSVSEIALPYRLTFAAVSKHLKVLEKSNLIVKKRKGKEQIVSLSPAALKQADDYLRNYQEAWNSRFDRLEQYLKNNP